jgi:hypothetical protein
MAIVPAEVYMIHNNGTRPFTVIVQRNKNSESSIVKIYQNPDETDDNEDTKNSTPVLEYVNQNSAPILEYIAQKLTSVLEYVAQKVFIGKSPHTATSLHNYHGPRFDGNSILLHIEGKKYIFIGKSIFSFESFGTIVDFVSPVQNNDVPTPFATDSAGRYYFPLDMVVAEDMEPDLENPNFELFKLRIMYGLYVGGKHSCEDYHSNPSERYDTVIKYGPICIKKTNDIIETLDKEQYVALVKAFGIKVGLRKFRKERLILDSIWYTTRYF